MFDARKSRMLEASRNQILKAPLSSVRQIHRACMTEMATLESDQVIPIDRLVSRRACHMSVGHSSSNSLQNSPSCWDSRVHR